MPETPAAQLIQQIQDWTDRDLEDLQAMIQGLLEARSQVAEETRLDGRPLGKRGGQGHIEFKMIPDKATGKQYGPYRYLRYRGVSRKTGKMALLSVYLGRTDRQA